MPIIDPDMFYMFIKWHLKNSSCHKSFLYVEEQFRQHIKQTFSQANRYKNILTAPNNINFILSWNKKCECQAIRLINHKVL